MTTMAPQKQEEEEEEYSVLEDDELGLVYDSDNTQASVSQSEVVTDKTGINW